MQKISPNPGTQKMLCGILANTYVLATKIWNFHVNYVGSDFLNIHPELGSIKDGLYSEVDSLAEQIRKLGGIAPFSLSEFARLAVIKENPARLVTFNEVFNSICNDFCLLDSAITKASMLLNDDLVTQNLLIDLGTSHATTIWKLRSSLGQA